jgi:hypothetical protein
VASSRIETVVGPQYGSGFGELEFTVLLGDNESQKLIVLADVIQRLVGRTAPRSSRKDGTNMVADGAVDK